MQLDRFFVGPTFSNRLVSIVAEDDHSSTDKVDDGKNSHVNEVHQELRETKKAA